MKKPPFEISRSAERELRRALETQEGKDTALVVTFSESAKNQKGEIIFESRKTSFTVGWYQIGQRDEESFYDIFGFPVSIMHTTMEHLEGKILDTEARGKGMRPRLTAVDQDAAINPC